MKPCPDCPQSQGYSPVAYWIGKNLQNLMWHFPSPIKDRHEYRAEYERITTFLAGRSHEQFGHDDIDLHAAARKLAELAGVEDVKAWERCKTCNGSGEVEGTAPRKFGEGFGTGIMTNDIGPLP